MTAAVLHGAYALQSAVPIHGTCGICGEAVTWDQPCVSFAGRDHYHTRCWNAAVEEDETAREEADGTI